MGEQDELRKKLFGEVIEYARAIHEKAIDEAYDYFWEEEYPEDYLDGLMLDIAFINFEDWLVSDRAISGGDTLIDLYIKENPGLEPSDLEVLKEMKGSVISLYEAISVSPEPVLRDLIFGNEFKAQGGLPAELREGELFGARFFHLDGGYVMGDCVYPYGGRLKDEVLGHINKQFNRFLKNDKGATGPSGIVGADPALVREFLKKYSDVFNIIWFSKLFGAK